MPSKRADSSCMKSIFTTIVAALALTTLACAETDAKKAPENGKSADTVIMSTSEGEITIKLNPEKAPITVKNFLSYIDQKFYDNTIFHRIIPGFMIQGGGFTIKDGKQVKKTTQPPIKNESANGLLNKKGTLSMARTNVWNSATSQFFINVNHNRSLDNKYAVFAEITKGYEVAEKIVSQPRERMSSGEMSKPKKPTIIYWVRRAE